MWIGASGPEGVTMVAARVRGIRRLILPSALVASLVVLGAGLETAARVQSAPTIPARLTDQEFWRLSSEFSEPDGYFQSDNLVSNERPFQQVVPALRQMKRGGVYIGVAPDQNFTYIVALEPKIAFIVDIRRGALRQHLMYKALMELSEDRADFLSRLFSRRRPDAWMTGATAAELFRHYWAIAPDEKLYEKNLAAIQAHLTKKRKFDLTADDLQGIEYIFGMFYRFGPDLTYSSSTGRGGANRPTYAELQQATDLEGTNHAYLATEAQFRTLKAIQEKNLIVPVVGDVAGPKALRAVGRYLAERNATVTAYYTSNFEQYLFQGLAWRSFYANLATLPLDDASTFIRSARGATVLDPIRPLLQDVADGRIRGYADVMSRGSIR